MTESSAVFLSQAEHAVLTCYDRKQRRVIFALPDRVGYGASSATPPNYSYTSTAADLSALITSILSTTSSFESTNIKTTILGHSSGGPCALALALLYPHQIHKCILVASDVEYASPLAHSLGLNDAMPPLPDLLATLPTLPEAPLPTLGFSTPRELSLTPAEEHQYRLSLRASRNAVAGVTNDYVLERQPWNLPLADFHDAAHRLRLVVGSLDTFTPPSFTAFFTQAIPGCPPPLILPGFGHFDIILDSATFSHLLLTLAAGLNDDD